MGGRKSRLESEPRISSRTALEYINPDVWRDKGHLRDWTYITVGVMALSVVLHNFMALIISPLKNGRVCDIVGKTVGFVSATPQTSRV